MYYDSCNYSSNGRVVALKAIILDSFKMIFIFCTNVVIEIYVSGRPIFF